MHSPAAHLSLFLGAHQNDLSASSPVRVEQAAVDAWPSQPSPRAAAATTTPAPDVGGSSPPFHPTRRSNLRHLSLLLPLLRLNQIRVIPVTQLLSYLSYWLRQAPVFRLRNVF